MKETGAPSLYDRLGGEAAVEAAVVLFYEKVVEDPTLTPFLSGLDLQAQIDKQIAFMTMVFGGPSQTSGRDLREAHAGLVARGLGDAHFDAFAAHLGATLRELGVDDATTGEVLAALEPTRRDVLSR
ncbi:MAG: group 1 truncated hemoglobin [Polyangiaceae bacterium]|nr:group 1 truncated hemoglobin [Polyangiaceae bacterium]